MRIVVGLTLAAGILVAASAMEGQPAHAAQGPLPWCEYGAFTSTGNGIGNCSYYTFQQCREAARGDGSCARNPRFDEYYFRRGIPAPIDIDPNGRPIAAQRRR